MRRGESTANIPVVFLTGRVEASHVAEAMRLGAHDYLRKPAEEVEIIARISAALRLKDLQDQLRLRNAELSAHATALEHANAELRAANQLANDLIAMLSHDLRQPLTGILGHADTLDTDWDELTDQQKQHFSRRIKHSAELLNQLIEEMLMMTQIDASVLQAQRTSVPILAAVHDAISVLGYEPHDVTLRIPEDVEVLVDPGHLRQILINLMGNAVKYGEPPVAVYATPINRGLDLRISDRGQGVPEEFVPHLFERFSRAKSGVATSKKGTGLGLFIASSLLKANGGSIRYEHNQPTGSMFVVRLESANPR
jgi:signal transduction histidine kinase